MSNLGPSPGLFESRCFLQERRFFRTVSRNMREALNADAGVLSDREFWLATEPIEFDDDLEEATKLAMVTGLSGAEAEDLARAIRCLGAISAADVVRDLRVAYAACVHEHHAAGHSGSAADLLCDLALQLVDPIRSLTSPCASLATAKILFELLSFAGIELDEWTAVLWIRVLHPKSRVGASTALRSLVADYKEANDDGQKEVGSLELESPDDLQRRVRRPGEAEI